MEISLHIRSQSLQELSAELVRKSQSFWHQQASIPKNSFRSLFKNLLDHFQGGWHFKACYMIMVIDEEAVQKVFS